MVNRPHYILAKYVSDPMRNEPRNIGVIVWAPWGVSARFLGEEHGVLDGRKIPSWVQSRDAYREWMGSWRSVLLHKKVPTADGEIEAADIRFLDALSQKGRGNYVLSDKGSVLDPVTQEDGPALMDFLFSTLVDMDADRVAARAAFDMERACNRIIKDTRAFRNQHFHRGKAVLCKITPHVIESLNFDYYVGNGEPKRLYQRVPLAQRDTHLHAALWQFERVIEAGIVTREKSAALVLPTPEQKEDERFRKAVSILETQTRVIDLSSEAERFADELNEIDDELIA